jgi:hypothetical protein
MALRKLISTLEPEVKIIGKYKLVRLISIYSIKELVRIDPDAIIVSNESFLKDLLQNDDLYLKPVFLDGKGTRQSDGELSQFNDQRIQETIERINRNIESYKGIPLPTKNDQRILVKLLRYLLSRSIDLKATASRSSRIGYSYPLIEYMSIESEPLSILGHLNNYAKSDFFQRNIVDKVNICKDCQSSYLNFAECCTRCNSLDLKSENLVHHFRCAYIGPESDFLKDEKMICPKCDHMLKHIGIDYDKPSEIHTCKRCNHASQETKMKATCVDCENENELDQLVTHHIYHFKPTEKGKKFALKSGEYNEMSILTSSSKDNILTHPAAYNVIRSHESKKHTKTEYSSKEMVISLNPALLASLNVGLRKSLLEELAFIIKPYLNLSDVMTLDQKDNLLILLVNCTDPSCEELRGMLDYNLNKMMIDNGWSKERDIFFSVANLYK